MSHFPLMVLHDKDADLEALLQPWHEYECTGIEDQYVVWVDEHDKFMEEYNTDTRRAYYFQDGFTIPEGLKVLNNKYLLPYASENTHLFGYTVSEWEAKTILGTSAFGSGSHNGIRYHTNHGENGTTVYIYYKDDELKEKGIVEAQVSHKDLYSFDEFMRDYHGYEDENLQEGRWGRKTNPNKKWDWWTVGGRWSNFIKMKPVLSLPMEGVVNSELGFSLTELMALYTISVEKPDKFVSILSKFGPKASQVKKAVQSIYDVSYIKPLQGNDRKKGYGDSAFKKDIDFEGIVKVAELEAGALFDKFWELVKDNPIAEHWRTVLDRVRSNGGTVEDARTEYHDQPMIKAMRSTKDFMWDDYEHFILKPESDDHRTAFIEHRKCVSFSTFAVVKDGQWFQRGDMGWWGIVSNEQLEYDWDSKVLELLENTDDETVVTICDCHI